jgi:hypothetical protein
MQRVGRLFVLGLVKVVEHLRALGVLDSRSGS